MKLFYAIIFWCFISCNNSLKPVKEVLSDTKATTAATNSNEFSFLTIENTDGTWGYQLLKDGKLMIDQKNIPAIQGNRGFSTKEKAEIMGKFILVKVKNGGFPPTTSIEEMDSLGVLN
jgi:hypothetical protein